VNIVTPTTVASLSSARTRTSDGTWLSRSVPRGHASLDRRIPTRPRRRVFALTPQAALVVVGIRVFCCCCILLPADHVIFFIQRSTVSSKGELALSGPIPGFSRRLLSSRRLSVEACNAYVIALEIVFGNNIASGFNGTTQVLISFTITSIDCNTGTRGETSEEYQIEVETFQSCTIGDEGCSENGKDDSDILESTLSAVEATVDGSITDSFNDEFSAAFIAAATEAGINATDIAEISAAIADSELPVNAFNSTQDAQIETTVITKSPTTSPTSSVSYSHEQGAKFETQYANDIHLTFKPTKSPSVSPTPAVRN